VTGSFLSSYLSYKAFPKSLPAQGKLVVWFSEISELRSVSDRLIPDEAYCDSSVAELFVSGEDFYKYLLINRKNLNLSLFDLTLFGYLFHLSRTRVFVKTTIAELAEDIQEPYSKVAKSIQVFISLVCIHEVDFFLRLNFKICGDTHVKENFFLALVVIAYFLQLTYSDRLFFAANV